MKSVKKKWLNGKAAIFYKSFLCVPFLRSNSNLIDEGQSKTEIRLIAFDVCVKCCLWWSTKGLLIAEAIRWLSCIGVLREGSGKIAWKERKQAPVSCFGIDFSGADFIRDRFLGKLFFPLYTIDSFFRTWKIFSWWGICMMISIILGNFRIRIPVIEYHWVNFEFCFNGKNQM